MLVDSHCHLDRLDSSGYVNGVAGAIKAAMVAGVGHFLCPGITLDYFPRILLLAEQHHNVMVTVGVHPGETTAMPMLAELLASGKHAKVVGFGETGLDYTDCIHDPVQQEYQRQLFRLHITAAKQLGKPLIVHSRCAAQDTIDILRQENASQVGGIMHCFTESIEVATAAMDMNFYIAFGGIITFKNADTVRAVAAGIPIDRLLLETDSPYLAPVPYRGKQNEPKYLPIIAEHMAKLRGLSSSQLAIQTTENFFRLFRV